MENQWTEEQRQVIGLRDCNMLVAAAAGSGKTAVLVERIISRILDEKKPVDIDRLLVVTFTNAAAAQMRERISRELERRLEQQPDQVHLQRQLTLIHHAQITTIHSFCLEIIRSHFDRLSLDPGFRIGDEGELKLLRQDVIGQVLEQEYETADPAFIRFSESFAPGRTDSGLEEIILQYYDFSRGYPWPERWREKCLRTYLPESREAFFDSDWIRALEERIRLLLADLEKDILYALRLTAQPDGPYMYRETLEADQRIFEGLAECSGYQEYAAHFAGGISWKTLSRKKDPGVSEAKRERVKQIRDQVKKELKKMENDYFFEDPDCMLEDMAACAPMIRELNVLAEKFDQAYEAAKADKNLVDFTDLEQYALQVLVREEDGAVVPTDIAAEYAQHFEEVMIDEYQDSNLVQEIMLAAVSDPARHNRFMVGDVKQSIYRFRLARPEIFMEKFESYRKEEGVNRRIDLHKNFRSRHQVLDSVNLIFRQIMTKTLGGVEYDDDAALYAGAVYPEGGSEPFLEPELYLLTGDLSSDVSEEEQEHDQRRREAMAAAERIREIVGTEPVWDKEEKCYRPARYSDVVVLLRTVSGWSEQFMEVFKEYGIPCYSGTGTGYFSALEIKTVLAYLKVLDNPRQDIPLASSLRSPIGGLDDEELAALRAGCHGMDFYTCCEEYLHQEEQEDTVLYRKLKRFWKITGELRAMAAGTPMHQLLWSVLDMTGYGDYASAMPGGRQRKANLDMLVEKAAAYESTSYRGLFHFVRYIENLQKYEIDYGEANISSDAEDTVQLMSIHKSKGLEFPIVLLCGLGKYFNLQDSRGGLVLHPELGAGCDRIDLDYRVKIPVLMKKMIAHQIREESLGEELRVLYVAMTRAEEKLILMGTVKSLEGAVRGWSREQENESLHLTYSTLTGAASYLDWIMPALLRHRTGEASGIVPGWSMEARCPLRDAPGGFRMTLLGGKRERSGRLAQQEEILRRKEAFLAIDPGEVQDLATAEYFEQTAGKKYPYEKNLRIPGKVSVSELKKMAWEPREESVWLCEQAVREIVPAVPKFLQKEKPADGARRGTVYHRILENLDFGADFHGKFMDSQLETMINCGKIQKDESELISRGKLSTFLRSELAQRMKRAAVERCLYREQPFVLGVPASQIREEWDPGEEVLIQGIIDAYFYEDREIVLLDYKTDYVPGGDPGVLIDRYRMQMDCYQMALERLAGVRVKERWIYSFGLGRAIPL